jgi:hypothetical protein
MSLNMGRGRACCHLCGGEGGLHKLGGPIVLVLGVAGFPGVVI